MELSSKRPYGLWSGLDDLLPTGRPGTEGERGDNEFFSMLYRDPLALKGILAGMTGISTGEATLLAARFPWKRFRTFCDIGCAQGAFPVRVAMTHRYPRGVGFEFSAVRPIFQEYAESFGLDARLGFAEGDYLENPLPSADVTSFGHVFDGRNHQICRELVERAYAAPPPGGAIIVHDAMIQPGPLKNRSNNFMTLLSSRNIMMESREGDESSTAACAQLLRAGGFTRIKVRHLVGPTSAVFGYKPGQLPTTA